MKQSPLFSLILFLLFLAACKPAEKKATPLNEVFSKINAEVLKNSKAYVSLKDASTSIGHRLTGSENGHAAEEFAFKQFKSYGFDDVAFQEFEVKAWSRGDINTQIDGVTVPSVTLAHSPVKADVSGEVADAGSGLESDYAGNADLVKGKIALIYIGLLPGKESEKNLHRSEKTAIAKRHGAIGVIIYNQVADGVMFTGTASVTGALIDIPAVCVSKETGMKIADELKKRKVSSKITMTNHSDLIKARNVIATLRGRELPDEKLIIGGHLDSWDLATGAIDNGIGSFAVMDIARTFKANDLHPRRTVQFVMFMGEEQGLLGSRHMVGEAVKDRSISNVKYMMNLDMAGNPIGINRGVRVEDTTYFLSIGKEIQQIDTIFKNQQSHTSGLHSDHQPFMMEGVPIVGVVSNLDKSVYDGYHSNLDTFPLVKESDLINTVRFGSMILYALADAEKLPAHTLDSEQTKQFMIDAGLKEPLEIAGEWKWQK